MAIPAALPLILGGVSVASSILGQRKQDKFQREMMEAQEKQREEAQRESRRRSLQSALGVPSSPRQIMTELPEAPNMDLLRTVGAVGKIGGMLAAQNIASQPAIPSRSVTGMFDPGTNPLGGEGLSNFGLTPFDLGAATQGAIQ